MGIILSDNKSVAFLNKGGIKVEFVTKSSIFKFMGNKDVFAVVGSRALAIAASKVEFPCLKIVQLTSAGYDGVPCEEFANKGIIVSNAGAIYSAPIAETVILGILLTAKRLHKNPNNRLFKIHRHYSYITEIKDKRILILGTGNIGTAIAGRLQGFDAVIDGYDKLLLPRPQYSRILCGRSELLDKIGEYDYIISTLPDTNETRGFIDKELIDRMSKNAVFINVGRKAVYSEDDLFYALKHKKINCAVLDMFELIPNPISNKFRRLSNVIVLPGVAAVSREVNERLRQHIAENIEAVVNRKTVSNVINGVEL